MVDLLSKPGEEILKTLTPEKVEAWHMATGISGEAGELLDAVKKMVIYNRPEDRLNLIEELGDIEFYLQGIRKVFDIKRGDTLDANIDKLMNKRYPNGYSDAAAQARADKEAGQ
jgi:NTP pyrophosphatase (non-canonical NTP hydrolase)